MVNKCAIVGRGRHPCPVGIAMCVGGAGRWRRPVSARRAKNGRGQSQAFHATSWSHGGNASRDEGMAFVSGRSVSMSKMRWSRGLRLLCPRAFAPLPQRSMRVASRMEGRSEISSSASVRLRRSRYIGMRRPRSSPTRNMPCPLPMTTLRPKVGNRPEQCLGRITIRVWAGRRLWGVGTDRQQPGAESISSTRPPKGASTTLPRRSVTISRRTSSELR